MKKIFFLAGFFLVFRFAQAECGSQFCYDYCTNSYLLVEGNTCGVAFDFTRGCYHGYGQCVSDGNVDTCSNGIECFDFCQNTYEYLEGDTCTISGGTGCFAAGTSCTALPLEYPPAVTVKGRVFDRASLRPIAHAVVSLELSVSGAGGEGMTNGHGNYSATVDHSFSGRAEVLNTCAVAAGYIAECYTLSSATQSVLAPVNFTLKKQPKPKPKPKPRHGK